MEIIDLTADERDKSQEINREDDEITLVPVSEVVDLIHDVDGSRRCSFKRELSFSENIWESKTEYSLRITTSNRFLGPEQAYTSTASVVKALYRRWQFFVYADVYANSCHP